MSFEKVEKPKTVGYLCCAGNIKAELSKSTSLDVGFGMCCFTVDGEVLWSEMSTEWTLGDLEKQYQKNIENGEVVLLDFERPLRDETYRLDKEAGKWHLIRQGMGFA